MTETKKPQEDREEEIMKKNIQKRFESMFTGEGEPLTNMSIHEVQALKARVTELETQLAEQKGQSPSDGLVSHTTESTLDSTAVPVARNLPRQPETEVISSAPAKQTARQGRASNISERAIQESAIPQGKQKQMALSTAGVLAAISFLFFAFAVFNLLATQQGQAAVSDQALVSLSIPIVMTSLISFRLIHHDRLALGERILYLVNVIFAPVVVALFVANIPVLVTGYLTVFSLIFLQFIFPRASRSWVIATSVAATFIVLAFEVWNPAFRIDTYPLEAFNVASGALTSLAICAVIVRQALTGSLRTKLISTFVIVAILSMALVAFLSDRSLRTNLTAGIVENQVFLANSQGIQIGQAIIGQFEKLKALATVKTLQEGAETISLEQIHPMDTAEIEQLNLDWRATVAAKDMANPRVIELLYNPLSTQLRNFQKTFPENVEILLTDQKGFSIASTNLPSNFYQADTLWWRTAHTKGRYIGQPIFNPATNSIVLDIAVPVLSYRNGEFMGVLRATVDFDVLTEVLIEGLHGQTGYSLIYQPNDQQIKLQSLRDSGYMIVQEFATTELQNFAISPNRSMEISLEGVPVLISSAPVRSYSGTLLEEGTASLEDLGWQVIVVQEKSEALQSLNMQARNNLMLTLLISIAVIIIAYFLARFITNPIIHLTTVAKQIALGDLSAEAKLESNDEIGTLASTFNNMTSQLRDLVSSLEQRVQDRTHDLELASEVGRAITGKVADASEMLTTAVELIRNRFELYYTQVYLTDLAGQKLILRAGTGEVGEQLLKRGHQLLIDSSSLNGQVVLGTKAVIVADTQQSINFRPNPLLPKTRSEMAVPLIANGQVIGVLDMQSEQPGTLTTANLPAFEALAGQLAIAIQNAQLFAQAQEARSEVEAQMRRVTELGWQDFLNAIERGQRIGFAFDQNAVSRLQPTELTKRPPEERINIPINVLGTKIGEIQLPLGFDRTWTPSEIEFIQATSTQLAQHIENLRLLAQAEHFQKEAEQAIRRLTREGWDHYRQSLEEQVPGYIFDLVHVQPLPANHNGHVSQIFKHPLFIRDETIGELAVHGMDHENEAREIIKAVAERLSGHIENLRLLEQTEQQRSQLTEALKTSRLGYWEYDFVKDLFTFNDEFYAIFRTTVEREGGYTMPASRYAERFVHPEDLPIVGAEIQKAVETTDPHYSVQLDHRVIFADGEIGYINVRFQIQKDEQGRTVRSYGANQDVTDRKRAEEAIKAEQQRTQTILESVTVPMVITRLSDSHLTFVNAPALEVAQFEYEQVINQPSPNFYANAEERIKFIAELQANGQVADMVVQLRRRGGEAFWALMSAKVFNYQNEPAILTTFMDISDRIHAEEAMAKRATELATVAQVSTTASTVLDPDELLQAVVDLTKERFGLYHVHIYLADESWNTLLLAAGAGEVGRQMVTDGWSIPIDHDQSIVATAARNRESVIANDVIRDRGSSFLSHQLLPDTRSEMAVPMIVGQQLLGVFDVQADTADHFTEADANIYTTLAAQVAVALQNARLYREQAATVTQLRELDKLKSSFLANMSHELRTPLNSILGFTDVMLEGLDGPLTEYMDNDLRLVQKNGQHLLHLINDVLDMAKIEAGRMNLIPETFKALEVMEEVTSITSTLAATKNLSLSIDEGSDQEIQIYADRTRVRQVIINLVNNAIKFTEAGTVSLKVLPLPGARILISVKDTGIGIAPDQLDAVFQEFTQVDVSSTRKAGGTGLGLPISRRLVEMHGGRLWAESTGIPGQGSTFFVELPLEARIAEVVEKQEK
jgi:PAS domain S-box-containing protein